MPQATNTTTSTTPRMVHRVQHPPGRAARDPHRLGDRGRGDAHVQDVQGAERDLGGAQRARRRAARRTPPSRTPRRSARRCGRSPRRGSAGRGRAAVEPPPGVLRERHEAGLEAANTAAMLAAPAQPQEAGVEPGPGHEHRSRAGRSARSSRRGRSRGERPRRSQKKALRQVSWTIRPGIVDAEHDQRRAQVPPSRNPAAMQPRPASCPHERVPVAAAAPRATRPGRSRCSAPTAARSRTPGSR